MISINYEKDNFNILNESQVTTWVENIISLENFNLGEINYIFCDDSYLHKINLEFLKHDTFTDIISFDYSVGKILNGDIYISVDRVTENAIEFGVSFQEELYRVMIHGVLHLCGYKDKTEEEKRVMRAKENACLQLLN